MEPITEETEEDVTEDAAKMAHDIWSGWMQYMFTVTESDGMGGELIPSQLVKRWMRQMITPYSDLSEEEKESDRNVMRDLALVDYGGDGA